MRYAPSLDNRRNPTNWPVAALPSTWTLRLPITAEASPYSSSRQEGLVYHPTAAFSFAALMNDW